MNYKVLIIGGAILAVVVWFVRVAMTPPPGTRFSDLGREHVSLEEVSKTTYNSNPPTSGKHLVTWVKPGIYTVPQQEGELLHSLEHGYVVISYNCGVHPQGARLIPRVSAHGDESATASSSITDEPLATGSAVNTSDVCTTLIKHLEQIVEKKKPFKLVLVPRPQLDTTIALAAWTYLDKFDAFDVKRIEKFIDYHRDHGPEQTME